MSLQTTDSDRKHPVRERLSAKLTIALDLMVWDGLQFADAARAANMNVAAMRKALERSHVRAYLKQQREVFRESISAGNLHTYKDVRDNSHNAIARIQAANALERLEDQGHSSATQRAAPGLVVQIINSHALPSSTVTEPNHTQVIDVAHDVKV